MILHRFANTLLKALMPLAAVKQAQAFGWDEEWLADVEADHDAWEADELWLAHKNFTGDPFPPEKVPLQSPVNERTTTPPVVPPTGDAGAATGVFGGALKSDEQIIEELVADYRQFLRQCFRK